MNLKFSNIRLFGYSTLLLLFFVLPLKAQVTIGAQKAPHSYSVLELESTKGGFRLPMLSNDDRDALKLTPDSTEASGLFIYNTDIDCVEFWSGGKWIDLCASALPSANINPATLATLTSGSGTLKGRTIFDIGVTDGGDSSCGTLANRAPYIVDFGVTSVYSYTFTASGTGTVRNVRYMIQDNEGVLQASQSLSGTLVVGTLANGASTQLTLNFKPDLNLPSSNPLIVGRDRSAAAKVVIYIIYNNGSTDVKVSLTLSIQDCSTGCSVKTTSGTWLTFMCYNLGAADTLQFMSPAQQAAYTNSADEYGNLYQWGRQSDGHQLRTSPSYPTNNFSYEIGTVSGSDLDVNGQVATTSAAYGKFIKSDGGNNDWRNPQLSTLWYNNGSKTESDPCPSGWRVPTQAEWQSIFYSSPAGASGIATANTWTWNSSGAAGYLIKPSDSSEATLFLPAAGFRYFDNSTLSNIGTGYYWSRSFFDNVHAYYVLFTSSQVYSDASNIRANGCSIRCVAE